MDSYQTDVLVIGGGTSGVCAAIQAARQGVQVIVVEETPWLGGMLSAAGVSAIDGNHNLPSGLWGEFRDRIYQHYGGPQAVETGWVSKTLFEPVIANSILTQFVNNLPSIKVLHSYWPVAAQKEGNTVTGAQFTNESGKHIIINAQVTVEATEYGDFLPLAGCTYKTGRESQAETGEINAPEEADKEVQDLTYVAILRDYGTNQYTDQNKPADYDPEIFRGCCAEWSHAGQRDLSSAERMLEYGRLPNNRFMINWPIKGNDYDGKLLELSRTQRSELLHKAKDKTRSFIYFIQHQLGFTNLALDKDQFPTQDGLPLIPYIRESRRVTGQHTLTLNDLLDPETNQIYREYIAVGDYPLDHHHMDEAVLASEQFPGIPAFGVPLGCLIPESIKGLLVAEKSISVTHIVNGCTRLQPVVMQIGQAAGAAAALCVQAHSEPAELDVKEVQSQLLIAGGWLMPYSDLGPDDPTFIAMQKAGVRGLIKGRGKPQDWENKYFIDPEKPVIETEIYNILRQIAHPLDQAVMQNLSEKPCSLAKLLIMMWQVHQKVTMLDAPDEELLRQALHFIDLNKEIASWVRHRQDDVNEPVRRADAIYLIDAVFTDL